MKSLSTSLLIYGCLIFSFGLCCVKGANITYDDVPEGDYAPVDDVTAESSGLGGVNEMSKGFANLVLKPFSEIEDLIEELLQGNIDDLASQLRENLTVLLSFEVGYLVCLCFGLLFILLVVLGGLITCCCRTCCSTCGGRYEQSSRRVKSSWRTVHCLFLFTFTVLITIPGIFVLLTNKWITNVVNAAPSQINTTLDNLITYAEVLPTQLQHTTNEFGKVNSSINNDLENIDTTIGVPIRDEFVGLVQPAVDQLQALDLFKSSFLTSVNDSETASIELNSGVNTLADELATIAGVMNSTLSADTNCTGDADCQAVIASIDQLIFDPVEMDLSGLEQAKQELNAVDIGGSIRLINSTLYDLPEMLLNSSQSAIADVQNALAEASGELDKVNTLIDPSTVSDLTDQINSFRSTLHAAVEFSDDVNQYRVILCAVLGAMILAICTFYLLGMVMGQCSYDPNPESRGCSSGCGGVLLMTGVGLSFMFAWLLMIVVIVIFTAGSHGERYLCQSIEAPYDGLAFVDKLLQSNESNLLNNGNGGLTFNGEPILLHDLVSKCESDMSLYETLNLEKQFNLSEFAANVSAQMSEFRDQITNINVDLTNLDVYNNETEQKLEQLTDTGIESLNLTGLVLNAEEGINKIDLEQYVEFLLNRSALIRNATYESLADTIEEYAANISQIDATYYAPLTAKLSDVNSSVIALETTVSTVNATVDATKASLIETESNILVNGTAVITDQLVGFADLLIASVDGYVSWVVGQIRTKVGACRPLYDVYGQLVTLTCDYLMDILGGLWFSIGWSVFFIMPAAIVAMKLAKFYRGGELVDSDDDAFMEEMEMSEYTNLPQQNSRPSSKLSLRPRSAKIHPSEYY